MLKVIQNPFPEHQFIHLTRKKTHRENFPFEISKKMNCNSVIVGARNSLRLTSIQDFGREINLLLLSSCENRNPQYELAKGIGFQCFERISGIRCSIPHQYDFFQIKFDFCEKTLYFERRKVRNTVTAPRVFLESVAIRTNSKWLSQTSEPYPV